MAVCLKESSIRTEKYIIAVAFTDHSWDFVTQHARDHEQALGIVRKAYDTGEVDEERTVAFVHSIGSEERFPASEHDPLFQMYDPDDRDPDEDEDEEWHDMEGDCDDDYLRRYSQ